jgi:tripartite-type tricarboxylate transporter receptor subunit TctC
VVPISLDPKNAAEFVKWAKARPGQLSYGSAGNGSPPHLAGELFKLAHGLDMQAVHYKGTGLVFPDLLTGRLQMMIISSTASKPYIDSGKVRALAISGTKRSPGLPGVPTFAEAGIPLPDLDFGAWWGLYAPGGVARDIVAKLNEDLTRTLAQPDVQERLATTQIETVTMTPEAFAKFVEDETSKWARVIQRAKIVAD